MTQAETLSENQTPPKVGGADFSPPRDDLLQCLAFIAKFYGDERTLASWRQGLPAGQKGASAQVVLEAAEEAGFLATLVQRELEDIPDYLFPVIVLLSDERACVWQRREASSSTGRRLGRRGLSAAANPFLPPAM